MPYIVQLLTAAMLMIVRNPMLPPQNRVEVDTVREDTTEVVARIDDKFRTVVERLVRDGWNRSFVESCFRDSRVEFIPKMVAINVRKPGSSDNSAYAWMYTDDSRDACTTFIDKYSSILAGAEQKYGVDRQTIAALLRCETRHGSVTGTYHVFSVYASMALMPEKRWVDSNITRARAVLADRRADSATIRAELERIRSRASTRGDWAYKELVNLLRIEQSRRCDAMGLRGSWAGAFGWSQFLPSSYLRSAVDGNGDGKIDLFDPADAIHSTANYLHKAGYRMGNTSARRSALRSYNNSIAYVESIVTLGDRVASVQKTTTPSSPLPATPGAAQQ